MQLTKVCINNFRSIRNQDINFKKIAGKNCLFLFGVNESGKSNVLRAISQLTEENYAVDYERDCNKIGKKKNEDILIEFFFNPGEKLNKLVKSVLGKSLSKEVEISSINRDISYNKEGKRDDLFWLHFKDGISYKNYWIDKEKEMIAIKKGNGVFYSIIDESEVTGDALVQLNSQKLDAYLTNSLESEINALFPEAILWESKDKYIITQAIDLEQFKNDPSNVSIPLRNIFYLAGYGEEIIKDTVDRILKYVDYREELEEELGEKISDHVNRLWPKQKIDLTIRFEEGNAYVFVRDKGCKSKYVMDQRSEGFRQLISILLTLSIESRNNTLENKIILIDEPEVHLHPSSIVCLKEELIKISENNIILAASHSPFMVDKKSLERNIIVNKIEEDTVIEEVDPKCPIQEEVIYQALGTSIFEIIEPNLLIFEGRTDKDAFDAFTKKFEDILKPIKIRTMAATGTKNMHQYSNFFKGKYVNGFFLVDSDSAGKGVKTTIATIEPGLEDNVFLINDFITSTKKEQVLEDLFPEEIIILALQETYGDSSVRLDSSTSVTRSIKDWKKGNDKLKKIDANLEELKKIIINKVLGDVQSLNDAALIKKYPVYYQYIEGVHTRLKGVPKVEDETPSIVPKTTSEEIPSLPTLPGALPLKE